MAIRPTTDRCRESLFSILGNRITAARVLDLYAGTGSLGLEALSRGAASVDFIDNSAQALTIIRKNLQRVQESCKHPGSIPAAFLLKADLRKGIAAALSRLPHVIDYDLIFLDPPYGMGLAQQTLVDLDAMNFLTEKGLIVAEEQSKVVLSERFTYISCVDNRRYGDTRFWFYSTCQPSP